MIMVKKLRFDFAQIKCGIEESVDTTASPLNNWIVVNNEHRYCQHSRVNS